VFFNEKAAARFHQQAAASLTIELYPAMRCTIRKHCLLAAVAWRWQPGQMAAAADARSEISGADRLSEACLALALAACCLHDVFRSMLHCHAWLLEPWPKYKGPKASQQPAKACLAAGPRLAASPRASHRSAARQPVLAAAATAGGGCCRARWSSKARPRPS
jgi:hypothetical protein